mmetsp:Transcript_22432/g.52941  ORF Transcript_22432/g.52941 Transcript_22432/m.52941 type:complete len:209 (+) Transcript_22432:966-1592(+)
MDGPEPGTSRRPNGTPDRLSTLLNEPRSCGGAPICWSRKFDGGRSEAPSLRSNGGGPPTLPRPAEALPLIRGSPAGRTDPEATGLTAGCRMSSFIMGDILLPRDISGLRSSSEAVGAPMSDLRRSSSRFKSEFRPCTSGRPNSSTSGGGLLKLDPMLSDLCLLSSGCISSNPSWSSRRRLPNLSSSRDTPGSGVLRSLANSVLFSKLL